jgi:hypothetical protein
MTFDSRLRQELHSAAGPDADVEGALVAVRSRHRRRVRGRRTAAALTSVLAVVALTLGTPAVLERWQDPLERDVLPPAATTAASLVGTYQVDVAASPAAEQAGMTGRWTVRLQEGGAVEMVPPGRFRGTASGSSYRADADVVRVDAFVSDVLCQSAQTTEPVGSYRWTRTSDTLVSSRCPRRARPAGCCSPGSPGGSCR